MSGERGFSPMDASFHSQSIKEMNVRSLKRFDPLVVDVLISTSHAVVYTYKEKEKKWVSDNIEGPVFVVKREGRPKHRLVMLNRMDVDNFFLDISSTLYMEMKSPYIFFRTSPKETRGLWFYSEDDCTVVAALLTKLISEIQSDDICTTKKPNSDQKKKQKSILPSPDAFSSPEGTKTEMGKDLLSILHDTPSSSPAITSQSSSRELYFSLPSSFPVEMSREDFKTELLVLLLKDQDVLNSLYTKYKKL